MAFSRNGSKLATGSVDENVTIWNSNLDHFAPDAEEKRLNERQRQKELQMHARIRQKHTAEAMKRLSQPVRKTEKFVAPPKGLAEHKKVAANAREKLAENTHKVSYQFFSKKISVIFHFYSYKTRSELILIWFSKIKCSKQR